MIELEKLKKYIGSHSTVERARMREAAYYAGIHPGIYWDQPKEDPDNRVPVAIPRKAVNFVVGYMAKPGNITYQGDYYEQALKDIYNECEESVLDAELLMTACKHGCAYEVHWIDGGKQLFAEVPSEQAIMIYTDRLGIFAQAEYFIRHWRDYNTNEEYAEVWDTLDYTKYKVAGGTFTIVEDSRPHGYHMVPAVEFTINKDKANLYNHVLALVDVLDKGVSEDLANELQRLANSYLLLANDIDGVTEDGNGETEVDKIKRTKVIANLREDVRRSVDFLTKNLDPSFINSALDRLERLIYELIGIPNPSDDTFAASSGIALAYKLIPLEYLATVIETYFTRGLQNRIRLISDGQYTMTGNESKNEVQISWMRNLPNDLITLTQVAMNAKGILSDETILRMFPSSIVSDVEEEMQKIVEQSDTIDIETVEPETTEETNGESGLS